MSLVGHSYFQSEPSDQTVTLTIIKTVGLESDDVFAVSLIQFFLIRKIRSNGGFVLNRNSTGTHFIDWIFEPIERFRLIVVGPPAGSYVEGVDNYPNAIHAYLRFDPRCTEEGVRAHEGSLGIVGL